MSQPLVVNQSKVYIHLHLDSLDAAIHCFVAVVVVAFFNKLLTKVVYDIIVLVLFKGLRFDVFSLESAALASQTFDQHTDRHP
jgi:uncharacterized protein YqhQ